MITKVRVTADFGRKSNRVRGGSGDPGDRSKACGAPSGGGTGRPKRPRRSTSHDVKKAPAVSPAHSGASEAGIQH